MAKIGLIIPWREQPSRVPLLKELLAWYEKNLPNVEIFYANRPGEFWQPSGSRNDGVKKAQEAQCDVIIINDADTIPEINPLLEAIEACKQDGMIHNPYRLCKWFTEEETKKYFMNNDLKNIYVSRLYDSNGGIYVCTPEAWWSIGGMDEKFVQWGFEDTSFEIAHKIIKGAPLIKHDGYIYSLAHKEQYNDVGHNESYFNNRELYLKYLKIQDAKEMLDLVKSKN